MDDYESLGAIFAAFGIMLLVILLVGAVVGILYYVANWKYFKKAGKPGWACLIPYYVNYVNCEIGGTKIVWFIVAVVCSLVGAGLSGVNTGDNANAIISLLSFACSVTSYVAMIIIMHNVFKSFGYGGGMTVLFIFFPIIPVFILGFGKAAYIGPASAGASPATVTPTAANAPPEMGKVCPNCGHALQPGESFCTNCGAKS